MTHIIAIANQRGGVGKTTSAVSLSSELALAGHSVLLVDFDPQGSATSGLGISLLEEGQDLFDVFFERVSLADNITKYKKLKDCKLLPPQKTWWVLRLN